MRYSNSDFSERIIKDIFTEGYELVLVWDERKWNPTVFINQCWIYHVLDEITAIELEQRAIDQGSVVLTEGSAFEMDVYSQLWERKGFVAFVRLKGSWL